MTSREAADRAARRSFRLTVVLAINLLVVVAQAIAGLSAHSLGLVADAGHNLTDVAALLVSLVAVRLSRRRPTASRSYGYHRAPVLAAQANAIGLLLVTILISIEAVRRLLQPTAVKGGVVVVVALIAVLFNGLAALLLVEKDGRDLNMRAALLHMVADAGSSAGVAVAGLVIFLSGGMAWLDAAVSLVVAGVIAAQALMLVREANTVLLESTPAGLDVDRLVAAMKAVAGVDEVHDVHAWSLSSEVTALSAHLVLGGHPTLEQAQAIGERVKSVVAGFGIAHVTLELECETCAIGDVAACVIDPPAGFSAGASSHGHPH